MLVFDTQSTMHAWSSAQHVESRRIGLVPTMGALHRGHVTLIRQAQRLCEVVVVSIFVNPLQFNRREDFDHYPRPAADDLELCSSLGVAAVYAPTDDTMYPAGFDTHIEVGQLADTLEGAGRPGHFRGVATVVAKLFNAVRAQVAVFGEKDFQQLMIISRMVFDLDMAITIVPVPTERESDGLAISSRNGRLSPRQRDAATVVPSALAAARKAFESGERNSRTLCEMAAQVVALEQLARLEYVDIVDPLTLRGIDPVQPGARVVIAVWFGDIRLIDNIAI